MVSVAGESDERTWDTDADTDADTGAGTGAGTDTDTDTDTDGAPRVRIAHGALSYAAPASSPRPECARA
jgi:hypothetical protein